MTLIGATICIVTTLFSLVCILTLVLMPKPDRRYLTPPKDWPTEIGDFESHRAFLRKHGFDDGRDDETKT